MSLPSRSTEEEAVRPIAGFHPTVWGSHFLKPPSDFMTTDTATEEQHAALKQEVSRMLTASPDQQLSQKLHLIDSVQRLGVGYQFQKEIQDELQKISRDLDKDGDDLYTVSLRFRLLRQQGSEVSCDVFKKFIDDAGKFKESMINDVDAMLSLYEAAFMGIRGEDILDEANNFTVHHLKSMAPHASPNLAEQIHHALRLPLRKSLPRLEARYFLDTYSRDDSHHENLLRFAKLDFNILQAAHQKELYELNRWWEGLDIPRKLPYVRDRLVEMYFWIMVGVYYEPEYAFGRNFVTKLICFISLIDDTFDAYGTFQELTLFTEAIRRWDIGMINTLPEYMRFIFQRLLNVFDEADGKIAKEGRSYDTLYIKHTVQELVETYITEAKWLHEGYVPSIDEYKAVSLRSIALLPVVAGSFLDMGDLATEQVFEWVVNNPRIIIASENICRLIDDVASHKFEQKRWHIPSAVECYMKQHGVSGEEAERALMLEIRNGWKDLNEELLNPTDVSLPLLERVLYLTQMCEFIYRDGEDRYTNSYKMKAQVALILEDPVTL